jgi:hypothetical protein
MPCSPQLYPTLNFVIRVDSHLLALDVFMEIASKLQGDPQGLLYPAQEPNPAGYFSWLGVIQLTIFQALLGSPCHRLIWLLFC